MRSPLRSPLRAPLRSPLCLTLLALCAGTASAQTYQLTAYARAHAVDFMANLAQTGYDDVNLLNQPGASPLSRLDETARLPDGAASAQFLGRIGLLKAKTSASYAYCCSPVGMVAHGGADGTVQASFYDTIEVTGAGLAVGTPVSYRIDLRIDGQLSFPAVGGGFAAYALAEADLTDLRSFQAASLRWDAQANVTGVYSLVLNTQVGHRLGLRGSLAVGARVESGAVDARSASANFYNTAHYELRPSVAGLNTLGASGTDFLAPVPEPASWALWCVAGLALLVRRRQGAVGGAARPAP